MPAIILFGGENVDGGSAAKRSEPSFDSPERKRSAFVPLSHIRRDAAHQRSA